MLKFNDLKVGDLVMAEFDGNLKEGEISDVNHEDKQVCVITGEQDFWYEADQIRPIPLDEAQLFKLGFQKEAQPDGSVKYIKGAFRVLIHHPNEFSNFEMWYREDRRHMKEPIWVHQFQNNYYDMTKVHLTKGA